MPNQRTMVRRIQRKRVVAHIPNPLSTSVLNVPDYLRTKIRGEPFYAFDSGKEDPNRFINFTTTQNLDKLEFSAKWAGGGAFAVCPSLFYQLYTVHGIIKDTTVLLVYCLMRNKTKEKYEELFAALKNLNAMLDPHEVTIDFEIAAIEALKSSFPNANIKGCFFSLCTGKLVENSKCWVGERIPTRHRRTQYSQIFRSSRTNPGGRHPHQISKTQGNNSKDAK